MERRTIFTIVILAVAGLLFLVVRDTQKKDEPDPAAAVEEAPGTAPAEEPGAEKPGAEKPGAEKPGADEPGARKPTPDKAAPKSHTSVAVTEGSTASDLFEVRISSAGGALESVRLMSPQFYQADRTAETRAEVPASKTAAGPYDLIGVWDAMIGNRLNLPFHIDLLSLEGAGKVVTSAGELEALEAYRADPTFARVAGGEPGTATFVWPDPTRAQSGFWIERTWRAVGSYRLAHELRFVNLNANAVTVSYRLDVTGWVDPDAEPPGMFSPPKRAWAPVCHVDGEFEEETPDDLEEEEGGRLTWPGHTRWFGLNSQYFLLAGVLPQEDGVKGDCTALARSNGVITASFTPAEIGIDGGKDLCVPDWHPGPIKCSSIEGVNYVDHIQRSKLVVFAGPKDLDLLQETNPALSDSLDFWMFGFLAKPMLYGLKLFYEWFDSWLLAILVLTLLIKGMMLPLTQKSYVQMQRMQMLKPEMEELQKKHANDKQKLQTEMMNLYKRHQMNPLGGCLPMVLQMPVYIALYRCIYSAVDLYQAPLFGWITDMTQPDPYYILPVALGGFMFIQQMFMPQSPGADAMQQKMIKYVMPVMFSVFMLMLPSGLVFYIFVSTVLGIAQQWAIKRKFEGMQVARSARSKA